MIKAHKKFKVPTMRRASRVYLSHLNKSKTETLKSFLIKCHDITQYFIDLFWQRKDFTATLADLPTVHKGRDKFETTTRLAQALAKQAKEIIKNRMNNRKPRLRKHTTTLYCHFAKIEKYEKEKDSKSFFDYAVSLIGSGAPRMVIPVKSTKHLNIKLKQGWTLSNTVRMGIDGERLFVDFILEKPIPPKRTTGKVLGMDSNYKHGLVFSDGKMYGEEIYKRIQEFDKRQKHTHAECRDLIYAVLNKIDFTGVKMIVIEDLKKVRNGIRGKFPRRLNRRMSHWLYASIIDWLSQHCEELGIWLAFKDPWKTSQRCSVCGKWDRRNRKGDKFCCIHCGHTGHADVNAAQNLEFLGLAGVYGLRLLKSSK
jgi:IS605 OrfB family transposase